MSTTPPARKAYPTDVTDAEWELVAPYLTLLDEDAIHLFGRARYSILQVSTDLSGMSSKSHCIRR